MTALSNATLAELDRGEGGPLLPAYDRSAVGVGIVHLGVGGFHRAHEALYVDRVLADDPSWGICGVGVREADQAMRDALVPQDGLYTLTEVAPDGGIETRVVGSIVRYLHGPDSFDAVIEAMADPGVRIVSLTITEGGFGTLDAEGRFVPADDATLADLDPAAPARSAFGLVVDALALRHQRGLPAFTVLSCDNIQHNGRVARTALRAVVAARHPEILDWVEAEVACPSSMVDRITPVTLPDLRGEVAERTGVDDRWPVRAESYLQWVLEDDFPGGRPQWEQAGAQLVPDVVPYEDMKLRLLNASHQVMSYPALLAGLEWVHEACRDADITALVRAWFTEARPTLAPVPGVDLDAYQDTLIARFGSEAVRDTLTRQVVASSDRLPTFLMPAVAENLAAGRDVSVGGFTLAAWGLWLASVARGEAEISDPRAEALLSAAAAEEAGESGALLGLTVVLGESGTDPRLRAAYDRARAEILEQGVRGALQSLLARVASS